MVLNQRTATLQEGYSERPVNLEDAQLITDLCNAWGQHFVGRDTENLQDIESMCDDPKWQPETATKMIFDPSGLAVAYVEIWDTHPVPVLPHMWLCIHPQADTDAFSAYLMDWAINRGRQAIERVPENACVVFESSADARDTRYHQIFKAAGMQAKDQSWLKMSVQMSEPPPAPTWPEGIRLVRGDDLPNHRSIFMAVRESFQDHRGYIEGDVEEGWEDWERRLKRMKEQGKFDPTLWLLAMEGDTIASLVLGKMAASDNPDQGYINTVGTRREYRGRGLALALMQQALRIYWERGRQNVALHVDGSSITGATRLYEKVGMSEEERYDTYVLELRPGEDLSTQ